MQSTNATPPRHPVVFLTDFVDVDRPADEVGRRLCGCGDWLVPLAGAATAEGDAVLLRLGPTAVGRRTGVVARILTGTCAERDGRTFVPIRWEAASHSGLFPVLDGDLELARLDDGHCRVAIQASYRPPLDALGRLLDTVVLHRVAEATVRTFLGLLAQGLEEPGDAGRGGAGRGGAGRGDASAVQPVRSGTTDPPAPR